MEGEFGEEEVDVFANEGAVALTMSANMSAEAWVSPQPLRPSPPPPAALARLSSHCVFACASFSAIGCPSWRTLCIVMRALNV